MSLRPAVLLFLALPLCAQDPAPKKTQVTQAEAFSRADRLVANLVDALSPTSCNLEEPRTLDVASEEGWFVASVQLRLLGNGNWIAGVSVSNCYVCAGNLRYYRVEDGQARLVSTSEAVPLGFIPRPEIVSALAHPKCAGAWEIMVLHRSPCQVGGDVNPSTVTWKLQDGRFTAISEDSEDGCEPFAYPWHGGPGLWITRTFAADDKEARVEKTEVRNPWIEEAGVLVSPRSEAQQAQALKFATLEQVTALNSWSLEYRRDMYNPEHQVDDERWSVDLPVIQGTEDNPTRQGLLHLVFHKEQDVWRLQSFSIDERAPGGK